MNNFLDFKNLKIVFKYSNSVKRSQIIEIHINILQSLKSCQMFFAHHFILYIIHFALIQQTFPKI